VITGATRVYAVLGDPVHHSLSPVLYNAAFRALGIDAVSVALRADAPSLPAVMRALAGAGGGGNITVPHKRLAAGLVATAVEGGAINTFWGEAAAIAGANTDPDGILAAWDGLGSPAGQWLIVGTGGSAIAAALAARRAGAAIAVSSRLPSRAAQFLERMTDLGVRSGEGGEPGLVLNCTPLGLRANDALPFPVEAIPEGAAVLDLVYRAGETEWVRHAKAARRPAMDGREVLLGQAIAAFRCWYPEHRPPTEVMRGALAHALR